MFRQPNFSNLRFNIIQAINPYIQNSSNKCFGKSIISLPNNKVKSTINLPKKLLNKNLKITSQPSVDLVTLSPDAKIANVSKPTQDSKVAYGKLIKKVLNRYFDNDNIDTDFQKDKKANLKQLVKEFEREQYRKYVAPRKKAKKLMNEDAVEKYKMMQQDILDEEKKHLAQLSYLVSKFPHIENKWNEGWKEAETGKDTSDESEKEEEVKESITEDVDQYRDYATAGLKNTLLNILREKYGEQVDEEDEQAIEEFFEPFASERELSPERINLLINEFMSDFGFDEKDKQDIEKEIMLRTVDPNNNTTIENDMENDLTLLRQLENDCSTMVVKNKLSNLINELETDQSSMKG